MRVFILLLTAFGLSAQPPAPAPLFSSAGIRLPGRSQSKLLAPGMVLELYGQNLAPEPWCGQARMTKTPYPLEVCGVRVLVGATPAELMYVGPGQINFKIPASAPAEGLVPFQVCIGAVCSAAVTMQFSAHKAFLTLERPASVHMPVWVDVAAPPPYEISYPCENSPWSFPGYEFEMRRNGQALARTPPPARIAASGRCEGLAPNGRLPLHLWCSFDQPAVYSVRFTARKGAETLYQSEWTDIAIEPFAEEKRAEWLRSLAAQVKQADAVTLTRDVIPSLLALPDEKALAILLTAIPADAAHCVNADCATLAFGKAALAVFDDALLRRAVPRNRLLQLCPPDGRCK